MAFGISSVKIYPLEVEKSLRDQFLQVCEVNLTAAASDSSLALHTLAAADSDGAALNQVLTHLDRWLACDIAGMVPVNNSLNITTLLSDASAGSSATETYVVTGLLTTDTILAVTQYVDGAGAAVGILSYGNASGNAAAADALAVVYNADPGANAKVKVTVLRAAAAAPRDANEFKFDWSLTAPTFTFAGGTATPTTMKLFLLAKLKSGAAPIRTSNA